MEKENLPTLTIDEAPKKRGRPRKYAENEYKIVEKPKEKAKPKFKLPTPTTSDNEDDDNIDIYDEEQREYEDSDEFKDLLEDEENENIEDVEEKPKETKENTKIQAKKPVVQTKKEYESPVEEDDLPEKPHIIVHKKHKGVRPRKIIVITHDSDVDSDDEKLKPAPKIVFKQATKSEPKPKIIEEKSIIRKVEHIKEAPKIQARKHEPMIKEVAKPKPKTIQSDGRIYGDKVKAVPVIEHDREIINNARNNTNPLASDPWLMEIFGL
jgi:hypothetical protein